MPDAYRGKDGDFDALRAEGVVGAEEPGVEHGVASKGPGAGVAEPVVGVVEPSGCPPLSKHFDGIMSTLYQPGFLGEFVAVLQAAPFPGPQAIQTPTPKPKARAAAEHVPRRPDTWKPLPFIIDEVDDIFDEFRGSMGGLGACDHLNSLLVPVKQLLMEGSVTKDHRHGRMAQFCTVHDPEGLYAWIEDQLFYLTKLLP